MPERVKQQPTDRSEHELEQETHLVEQAKELGARAVKYLPPQAIGLEPDGSGIKSDYYLPPSAVGHEADGSGIKSDYYLPPSAVGHEADGFGRDSERSGEEQTQALANVFHEVWLRTRNRRGDNGAIHANGDREPRVKSTTDSRWVNATGRTEAKVDIANTGFVKLPEDWRTENLAAAAVIVELIEDFGGADRIDLSDPGVYAKCGARIHDRWLERNTYAKGGELDVPFEELTVDEQAKDLEQLKIALELFGPEKEGVRARPFETRALHTVNNWALERRLPIRTTEGDLIGPDDPDGWMYYEAQRAALLDGRR